METDCRTSIGVVINQEIIPRLLEAHQIDPSAATNQASPQQTPVSEDVLAFAQLCVSGRPGQAQEFSNRLVQSGMAAETVFLGLIGPAARYLGSQWEKDQYDFVQVTQGLIRMHEITHRLGYDYLSGPQEAGPCHRILLSSAPGSQHILGPVMISGFFRKAGWQVVLEISSQRSALVHTMAQEWIDVVGISVSTQNQLNDLAGLIGAIRGSAKNRKVGFLVGGAIFSLQNIPEHSPLLAGAKICMDPTEAVTLAKTLLA
jgi:MerR family transcriptional regulator, light-induced transcriptional regulator